MDRLPVREVAVGPQLMSNLTKQEVNATLDTVEDDRTYPSNTECLEPCSNMPGGVPTPDLAFLEGVAGPGNISWYPVRHPSMPLLSLSRRVVHTRLAHNGLYHQ